MLFQLVSSLLLLKTLFASETVAIKPGSFLMGSPNGMPHELPVHSMRLGAFAIDRHEVTFEEFARFVKATGYRTEAEKLGWGIVFDTKTRHWKKIDGATWRAPEGKSGAAPKAREPVTQVSWSDAVAFCHSSGGRLPTEAEFEYAARGGLEQNEYSWGNSFHSARKKQMLNAAEADDGYQRRAPVEKFPSNGYGLFDMAGNVWEWCADWYNETYYARSNAENPRGPEQGQERVIRGGSWVCNEESCSGYRVAARSHATPESAMNNLGFRCAHDVK